MMPDIHFSSEEERLRCQEAAVRNEQFVGACIKKIHGVSDAEEALRVMLRFLGESLECERTYIFEEIDRQHISNTYEWCRDGIPSGMNRLPYASKKDLQPWYERLTAGESVIVPRVEELREENPLLYSIMADQGIHSVILSPLFFQEEFYGFLGADNPEAKNLDRIPVLLGVMACLAVSLLSQRELARLKRTRLVSPEWGQGAGREKQPRFAGKSVLLVDDSQELLKLNERILRPEGYRILRAAAISEAEEVLRSETPDAIVMDIELPDGNGIAFCRRLRERSAVPVIFLTARSDQQTVEEGMRAGGNAYLTKPYDMEEFKTAVGEAVNGRKVKIL